MKMYTVRVLRRVWEYVDIDVVAGSGEEAMAIAVDPSETRSVFCGDVDDEWSFFEVDQSEAAEAYGIQSERDWNCSPECSKAVMALDSHVNSIGTKAVEEIADWTHERCEQLLGIFADKPSETENLRKRIVERLMDGTLDWEDIR